MKSPRWRAVNQAFNRDGQILAVREAIHLKEALENGKAEAQEVFLDDPDGGEPLLIRQVVMK